MHAGVQIRVPKTLAFKTRLRANLSCENDPFYMHENSLSLALKRKLESNWYLAYLTLVVAKTNGFNFQIMDS